MDKLREVRRQRNVNAKDSFYYEILIETYIDTRDEMQLAANEGSFMESITRLEDLYTLSAEIEQHFGYRFI